MEWLVQIVENPLVLPITLSVFDIIMMIVIYRRTGKIFIKPVTGKDTSLNIVNDDLTSLVEYHEHSAVQLRKLLNQSKEK